MLLARLATNTLLRSVTLCAKVIPMSTTSTPIEIAFRIPGSPRGWVRKTFRTEAAAEQFVDRLLEREGDDVEIRWAD